jgi:hypothetical protein
LSSAEQLEPNQLLNRAEQLLQSGNDPDALKHYQLLVNFPEFSAIAHFRLGEVLNRIGDISGSLQAHRKAFETCPELMSKITPKEFKHHTYIYQAPIQLPTPTCPLCQQPGSEHSCYNTSTYLDFAPGFDPVRLWLFCTSCSHIFASHRPENLEEILRVTEMGTLEEPDVGACPGLGQIMQRLIAESNGLSFFEVGVGSGEMIGVACEFQLEASGIEIRPDYARRVAETFSIPIHIGDFLQFNSDEKFDILCMGDVLEHFIDPHLALQKAADLLSKNGILWISTPNFDSAYCRLLADKDPMWRVCEHLHFFSFQSLKKALDKAGLKAVRYEVSSKYRGSMEVTCRKKDS